MNPKIKENMPRIGAQQIRLLERLCNASAVSGDEGEVRKIVLEQVRKHLETHAGEVKIDSLGNVLVTCPGQGDSPRPRLMLAAHMDEVGMMITKEEEKGIFRFELVGGIDPRQLAGKAVLVGHKHVPGVLGAKPIHLSSAEERKNAIPVDALRIDVGLENDGVEPGIWATFATRFQRVGNSLIAKALDNRYGVATLIELVKNAPPNIDLLAAFTVQEEIGSAGARVAAYAFNPDAAFILDSTPAYDLPTWEDTPGNRTENTVYNTRLDAGPAIYLADAGTLSDQRLVRHLAATGDAFDIPYQYRQPGGGGTDARVVQRSRAGVPAVSVSVPSRYQHTAASVGRISDWENTLSLMYAALSSFTFQVLEEPNS